MVAQGEGWVAGSSSPRSGQQKSVRSLASAPTQARDSFLAHWRQHRVIGETFGSKFLLRVAVAIAAGVWWLNG